MSDLHEQLPRRNPIEWLLDAVPPAQRRERMLEQSKVLDCEPAMEATLALVRAVEGFTKIANIYLGPSDADIAAERKPGIPSDEAARIVAWNAIRKQHEQFDLKGASGPSDWLRLLGVWRAALEPGADVPGILTLRPEQFRDSDPAGKQFADWARHHHLSPRALATVAQQVQQERRLYSPRDQDQYLAELQRTNVKAIEQAVMAGFDLEEIYLQGNSDNNYLPWNQALLAADPAERSRLQERVKAVIRDVLTTGALAEEAKKIELIGSGKSWVTRNHRYQYVMDDLLQRAERIAEQQVYGHEQGLEISNQSSGYQRRFPATVITAQSQVGDRFYGHGVHAVSAGLIRVLAPDKVVRLPFDIRYDREEQCMAQPMQVHLVSRLGPFLGNENDPIQSPDAVGRFAHILATGEDLVPQLGRNRPEPVRMLYLHDHPWLEVNHQLLEDQLMQNWARSRGQLARDFDLTAWYRQRLEQLGNITSLEAATAHQAKLQLQLVDLYPLDDQQEPLRQLEQTHPNSVHLGNVDYPVHYHYSDLGEGSLGATIVVPTGDDAVMADFLQLKPSAVPTLGTAAEPLAITFRYHYGQGMRENTDLITVQDALDPEFVERQWQAYPQRDYQQPVLVNLVEPLPDPAAVIAIELSPYGQDRRGQLQQPIPAIRHHDGQYRLVLCANAIIARDTQRGAVSVHEQQRRQAEIRNLAPEVGETARAELAALQADWEAIHTNPYQAACLRYNQLHWSYHERTINRLLDSGETDAALVTVREQRANLDHLVVEPARQLQQAENLVAKLKDQWVRLESIPLPPELGTHYRFLTLAGYDRNTYYQGETQDKRFQPPAPAQWPAVVIYLEQLLADTIRQRAEAEERRVIEEAEALRVRTAFEALPAAEQLAQIQAAFQPLDNLVTRIERNLQRQPRRGPNARYAAGVLEKLRERFSWINHYRDGVQAARRIFESKQTPEVILQQLLPIFASYGAESPHTILTRMPEYLERIQQFRESTRLDFERIVDYLE